MPTAARLIYDGAVCHIIQRGNNRQKIFKEEDDYKVFLSFIERYKGKYAFDVFNYCLMSNHLHLLIRMDQGRDLSKVMQGICQSYRFYYRKKYRYTGYLYQGRYKSKVIDKDLYLLECARYIERNPLRANMVKDLAQYAWTSYLVYARGQKNGIITVNPLYMTMGSSDAERQSSYEKYLLEDRMYEHIIDKEFKITY